MVIKNIKSMSDGTFIIELNGYPFHATAPETPEVFDFVKAMIDRGEPVTDYVAPPHVDDQPRQARTWRDGEIERVKWLRERHRDEIDRNRSTTLSGEQFGQLLDYIQALRDWPQSADFPDVQHRPAAPPWIAEQAQ
ncbi:phage tail assembly chaperone [Pseudomonas protegens]|uniref:phage tail assembly chaperone n=1 Tax=Pseudomonas protegens TaxID=380021 RepID=UPI000B23D2D8|nr:phage tail assembly chaperone [Pseudomonas protegens]MDP9524719.1 phage tail assembly chaperone [Pseudomonas protegens]